MEQYTLGETIFIYIFITTISGILFAAVGWLFYEMYVDYKMLTEMSKEYARMRPMSWNEVRKEYPELSGETLRCRDSIWIDRGK